VLPEITAEAGYVIVVRRPGVDEPGLIERIFSRPEEARQEMALQRAYDAENLLSGRSYRLAALIPIEDEADDATAS
jgi:hypothetical protein